MNWNVTPNWVKCLSKLVLQLPTYASIFFRVGPCLVQLSIAWCKIFFQTALFKSYLYVLVYKLFDLDSADLLSTYLHSVIFLILFRTIQGPIVNDFFHIT